MKISIITVFPELFEQFLHTSLIARAQELGLIDVSLLKFSDMCPPKTRIDEPTCGPGAGMIIKPDVIQAAIEQCEQKYGKGFKIFFSPQGKLLTQSVLNKLANFIQGKTNYSPQTYLPTTLISHPRAGSYSAARKNSEIPPHLILICSRYEGIDARVEAYYADAVFSIGDYVLMGGDIPAQVFLEGFLRLIPTVVGNQESVEKESFSSHFLDHPEYGLPKEWQNLQIPEIIFSGNHAKIAQWREEQAQHTTLLNRFDWFKTSDPAPETAQICLKKIPPHYVALMHTEVELKNGTIGNSSVTSLDIHDIARSASTYGLKNTFMITPLEDQHAIIHDLLNFWKIGAGRAYNETRFHAVSKVITTKTLSETITLIEKQENQKPILIATSAQHHPHKSKITYFDQGLVWKENRPVLFLFGTGQGLCNAVLEKCDHLLVPVSGMSDYKHLSVRSAAAIVFDRWLGLNPKN